VTTAEPQASLKPAYEAMFDGEELARIEDVHAGGAALVLGMIKSDMEWHQQRITLQDTRDHTARLLSIWLTAVIVVVAIGGTVWLGLAGQKVAGSILASTGFVAIATALVNAWRRNPTKA
jgi:hypothetical protein